MSLPIIILTVCGCIAAALLSLLIILALVYLLFFVRPLGKEPTDRSLLCDYAHRGLHGDGVPENSLEAFELACRAGYGIELDVQLSSDGEVMVFHDYTLIRMTGCEKKLCELTASELSELRLGGTEQRIPTFKQVLELVGGRVPILVELKGESLDSSLCEPVAELLREYRGSFCVESFNPILLKSIKKLMPDVFRGILYTNTVRDKKKASALNIVISLMAMNFLCKPNFIAYNEVDRGSAAVKLATRSRKIFRFVWTVKSRESFDRAHELGEYPIFEKIDRK